MDNEKFDEWFRDKINQQEDLPAGIEWNSDSGWQKYLQKNGVKKTQSKIMIGYIGASAAALLIIAFFITFYDNIINEQIVVVNDTDTIKEVVLSDGTRVWMNTNSSIEYPSKLYEKNSQLLISGEVYMETNKTKLQIQIENAIVYTEAFSAINIRSVRELSNIDVTVAKGAIKVTEQSYEPGLSLLITAGSYCSIHKTEKIIFTALNDDLNYIAWKTGEIIFDDSSMESVVHVLSKYYDMPIEIQDYQTAYCSFSGTFDNQQLDTILQQIKQHLHIIIKKNNHKIVISGKGC